jgi:hypothetical protein
MENSNNIISLPVSVEHYVYEKVKKFDVILAIPQEPIYFQEYNHRVVIGIFPQFATWSDNSVTELQIVEITDKKLLRTSLPVTSEALSKTILRLEVIKTKIYEDVLQEKVINYLKGLFPENRITKDN